MREDNASVARSAAITRNSFDLICFSHLRWGFVYQRPQHLLTRAARNGRVFFFEEPLFEDVPEPKLRKHAEASDVVVVTPVLPHGFHAEGVVSAQKALLNELIAEEHITDFIAWYYTPMALLFAGHLHPSTTVYDCMDELSAFDGSPAAMSVQEQRLFACADVVFTGGQSLYEAKRDQHPNVFAFPSSVDRAHFAAARDAALEDPQDQATIPHPRIGFFGVLDERLDRGLLQSAAACNPAWHFILVGPTAKISEDELPRAENLHYLGRKQYDELPRYLAQWDVAMLPFARNASTRYISPTKTPEYLAAGKPVVSTAIRDVVEPYGRLGFARIAEDADGFCAAIRAALADRDDAGLREDWLARIDTFLQNTSWDRTFDEMWREVIRVGQKRSEQIQKGALTNV